MPSNTSPKALSRFTTMICILHKVHLRLAINLLTSVLMTSNLHTIAHRLIAGCYQALSEHSPTRCIFNGSDRFWWRVMQRRVAAWDQLVQAWLIRYVPLLPVVGAGRLMKSFLQLNHPQKPLMSAKIAPTAVCNQRGGGLVLTTKLTGWAELTSYAMNLNLGSGLAAEELQEQAQALKWQSLCLEVCGGSSPGGWAASAMFFLGQTNPAEFLKLFRGRPSPMSPLPQFRGGVLEWYGLRHGPPETILYPHHPQGLLEEGNETGPRIAELVPNPTPLEQEALQGILCLGRPHSAESSKQ